jgi:hypothetical protein
MALSERETWIAVTGRAFADATYSGDGSPLLQRSKAGDGGDKSPPGKAATSDTAGEFI